jgi:hypothetical protein
MLELILTVTAGFVGYLMARNFVARRLRFVDAIHSRWAPPVAGVTAFLLVWPLALLPVLSVAPAVCFGAGIWLGTARGARIVRRADGTRPQLTS